MVNEILVLTQQRAISLKIILISSYVNNLLQNRAKVILFCILRENFIPFHS